MLDFVSCSGQMAVEHSQGYIRFFKHLGVTLDLLHSVVA